MYSAVCSQCKKQFRAMTRTRLLSRMRIHLWKVHRAWMIKRIKAGVASKGSNPMVLRLLRDLVTGDFIPGYKEYKRSQYEMLKPTLDIIAKHMPPPVQAAWKVVDNLAEKIFR
ncbi:hypothetical protein ES705_44593 [subsurface metagenome]